MNFRDFYEYVEFVPNKRLHIQMKAKQGDSGRGFEVSVGESITTLSLTAYFELPDGSKDNVLATKKGDRFMIRIPTEVFRQVGNLKTEFVLESDVGNVLAKEYFNIPVAKSVRGVSE